ncbi:MAG: three-Cys-motif partner protein TcmP [Candidatus Thorarchaeota archaeon]
MPLRFHNDAIVLSGLYGTKLKTEIIDEYYGFWLDVVTSPTFGEVNIVEMDAGTGELYIEDINRTILGSAGRALALKYGTSSKIHNKLNVILIEQDKRCRTHMDNVLARRWPSASFSTTVGKKEISNDGWITRYKHPDDFLDDTKDGKISGISLFFFDPLLSVAWTLIERIAEKRITVPYRIGTEFLIFFFTSDWLHGRKTDEGEFKPLPRTSNESKWNKGQQKSAKFADDTFGGREWLDVMSSGKSDQHLERGLVSLYKKKLRKWFRFVVPLPFIPKTNQIYHVFCCSNFDVGTNVLSKIYESRTQKVGLQADNKQTYSKFKRLYPTLVRKCKGRSRPSEWKVLWHVMRNHADGICDETCRTLREDKADSVSDLKSALKWLKNEGFLKRIKIPNWPWKQARFPVYKINWKVAKSKLGVEKPLRPRPLMPP